MTKRISHILLSLLLTVTIVSLGSGVTLVRCMHSGCVSVATLADLGADDCAGSAGGCMETTLLQLDNLTSATPQAFDFHPTSLSVAVLTNFLTCRALPVTTAKPAMQALPLIQKGPPRAYLTLLRTLLI